MTAGVIIYIKRENIVFKRKIESLLYKALDRSPVTLLNGARQVGKTTLVQKVAAEKGYSYITFDDELVYLAAKNNPEGFISAVSRPVIIDEVQRVPEIFLAIKRNVDKDRVAGSYLLTGSANPLLLPRLGDSLAGRMEVLELLPLSQSEMLGGSDGFIDWAFGAKELKNNDFGISKKDLYEKMIIGGYPSVQGLNFEDRQAWMKNYIGLIINRDVRDLSQIEKIGELPHLLKVLANRAANLLNTAEVSREIKIVNKTLQRYMILLETVFITQTLLSWHSNSILRFVKSPKLYLVDTGLLSYLLDANMDRLLVESYQAGKILENFVVCEIKKYLSWNQMGPDMYHFRTSGGHEVDIVLENRRGEIVGIEVKNSERVTPSDLKGLRYLANKTKDKFMRGILLYTGDQVVPFGDDIWAMPVSSIWKM